MKPSIRQLDMEMDFQKHKQIQRGIRQIAKKKFPVYDGKVGALPPLNHTNSENDPHQPLNLEVESSHVISQVGTKSEQQNKQAKAKDYPTEMSKDGASRQSNLRIVDRNNNQSTQSVSNLH